MNAFRARWHLACAAVAWLMVGACAATPGDGGKGWKKDDLVRALANPGRPQADRDRDADRKPADLMLFFGVEPGMTAVDLLASGGYLTDVLSVAVGPTGKVYSQNPPAFLTFNNGIYGKALTERLANNRLPNVVRVDSDLPTAQIAAGSVDFAITALNFHDLHNRSPQVAQTLLNNVFAVLKPGGVLGLIDHVGKDGADNAKLHRVPKHFAIDAARAAGFVVEAESNVLAHPADDSSKVVFDPELRGKTDQFVLRLRKPK